MSTKPSPTTAIPWHVDYYQDNPEIRGGNEEADLIAEVIHDYDAELICRAVNHHERLVKALKEFVQWYEREGFEDCDSGHDQPHSFVMDANALLSELEQEEKK